VATSFMTVDIWRVNVRFIPDFSYSLSLLSCVTDWLHFL